MAKERKITVRLELDPNAAEVLDRLTVNSRRKSEVVNLLLMAAAERQERIDNTQDVPLDGLTRALLNLGFQRDLFGTRKAKQGRENS